ncbi:dynein heavy chain, putative [Plasmodium knowlesi strain H]|uniref:Dynein heavy chain, putative n=3 Tax=Plasmodium knowlesi TaxID=5850 RepID=A0A5K1VV76_PLAKH|nr:dynein heavy chain, putative [Plasmodium knowlesi strain H]OTN65142.1 putative Dynein heavy chain [Plasmodium knowlesi]CAA9988254.1 dynein heavy chain, putative [Plasmodium knowlesi strain H]SBO20187.1 dynein heavy chain, putative [Plasmodium knowlesi strain H]SBO20468.1 dynein heavy chain, putative [Plasmodium knowlesi strain H]VVS77728.1 dynein heavy chain, putative [Plasmodium knowlesi strain H]|eukprot:XP_002259231.1 dynein heavy chain, putative [Plasmodium knowlesi strain H]
MTKDPEAQYEALSLTELKSNVQEKSVIGYSVNFTIGGVLLFGGFKVDAEADEKYSGKDGGDDSESGDSSNGRDGMGTVCNDAYLVHIKNEKVEYEMLRSKVKPQCRCYHNSCTLLENYVVIFGGLNSEVPFIALNDLWIFNSANKTFTEIKLISADEVTEGVETAPGSSKSEAEGDEEMYDGSKLSEEEDYTKIDTEDDGNNNSYILNSVHLKKLGKYLNCEKDQLASQGSCVVPAPRYFSSLDLYVSKKGAVQGASVVQEVEAVEEAADQATDVAEDDSAEGKNPLSVKNNKIVLKNANAYEYFSLILFGGYGGYDRSSFNDLYEYDILRNQWILRTCKGSTPSNRYGHVSFINENNLFILGGTNSEISFNDMYACNLRNNEWSEIDFSYSFNVSKVFCRSVMVESIDRNIIFIFGGYNIVSDEKGNRKIEYSNAELNMLKLYDTFKLENLKYTVLRSKDAETGSASTGIGTPTIPTTASNTQNGFATSKYGNNQISQVDKLKVTPRAETHEQDDTTTNINLCSITYDSIDANLIITDSKQKIYVINISRIIGPKYAIFSLMPKDCDIEGEKKILLKGKGFMNEGKISIKYTSDDVDLFSEGIYINENYIYTIVPSAKDKIKNNICHVHLSINDKCYTTNKCLLEYYYNIDPKKTLIFGSGLLEPICLKEPNIFFLIARNSLNEKKKIGGDKFQISITYEQDGIHHDVKYTLYDVNNGFYIVKYFPYEEEGVAKDATLPAIRGEEEVDPTQGNSNIAPASGTSDVGVAESPEAEGTLLAEEAEKEENRGKGEMDQADEPIVSAEDPPITTGIIHISVKLKGEDTQNSPFALKVYNRVTEKATFVKKFINDRLEDLIKKGEHVLNLIRNKDLSTANLIELNVSIENFLNNFSKSIYDINTIEQYILYGSIDAKMMEPILGQVHREENLVDASLEDESFIERYIDELINGQSGLMGLTGESDPSGKSGTEGTAPDSPAQDASSALLKVKDNEGIVNFIDSSKMKFVDCTEANLVKRLKSYIALLNSEESSLRSRKEGKRNDGGVGDTSLGKNALGDSLEECPSQGEDNQIEVITNLLNLYHKLKSVCICKKEKELKEEFLKEEKESIKTMKLNYNKFVNIKKNLETSSVYTHSSGYEGSLKELENMKKYVEEIKEEVAKVEQISKNIVKIDNVEELSKDIDNLEKEIDEIEKLWMFIKKKDQVLNGFLFSTFNELDVEEFDMQMKNLQNEFKKIKVDRKHNIWKEEMTKLKDTIKFVSVISELKKTFIKDRHIKEIEVSINEERSKENQEPINLLIDENTLTIYFYKLNVIKYHESIEEVIIKAYNEKSIEEIIQKFEDYWDGIYFKHKDYKNGIILTYIDDMCIETIEEHQMSLQNCFSSKYFLFFSSELNIWQKKITNIYEVILLLKDIEKLWMYLQNMYVYSEEVKKELPLYSKFFLIINDEYLEMLKQIIGNNTKVVDFANDEGIIEKLEELKSKLCKSEKPLNEYLDSKRKSFPRFFFISSTDLIDILSNGNNFKLVNTHVQKIFLSIRRFVTRGEVLTEYEMGNEVNLGGPTDAASQQGGDSPDDPPHAGEDPPVEAQNEVITKLISSYGEEICKFHEPLVLKGKVECYLNDIIKHIKYTLKYYIANLFKLKHMYNTEKDKWIDQNYLSQVFILCNSIFFVHDVENILRKGDSNVKEQLKTYYKNHITQLENVIKKVQKKLSVKNRIKIMCIITLDTFYRDILEVILKNKNCISINMFDWQSQIRMYPYFNDKTTTNSSSWGNTNSYGQSHGIGEHEKVTEEIKQSGETDPTVDITKKDMNQFMGNHTDDKNIYEENSLNFKQLYIKIKIMDCSFNYSYDYIGNYQRLVITPLTSRIYITATQALSLYMGCAPAGPAGTGKTETTKDLSSFFGKNCYVFNCSDQLDYKSMGNIFKGIGSTGCWCCFDEFNRLIPEVLSVCSIQFKSILDCKRNNNNVCIIGSDEIIVKKNCAVFITMNPDYLGRSKLPESLKILFRPITVIVPDFNKICENMLMAEGYVDAKYLSIKFTTFFELAQSLLKEKHCDWGLRSIKSVLTKAGFLKRTYPDLDENKLLYSAIHDINIAKISASNCPVFSGLLNDIFFSHQGGSITDANNNKSNDAVEKLAKDASDVAEEKVEGHEQVVMENIANSVANTPVNPTAGEFHQDGIEEELMEICKRNHLFGLNYFVKKIMQLNDIINIRHCVFIMGEAGCGKTTLFNMLMEYQKQQKLKTVSIRINPKSISIDDLYGSVHIKTREWKDGVFSKYMRNYSKREDCDKAYIIFDGNLDSHWIENMNSVMDDNKVLTLSSNERILLKNHMNLVFEFSDLMFATPATISRAGLVYFSVDPNDLWKNYFLSWIDKHDNFNSTVKKAFEKLMYKYVEPTFNYLTTVNTSVKVSPISHIQSLAALLDILLKDNNFESMEHYFVYAVIWSFGSFLGEKDNANYKKSFDKYWKNTFKSIKVNRKISVFDFFIEGNKFKEWEESEIKNQVNPSDLLQDDIFVETVESCSYKYISKLFLKSKMPILFIGKTGVGKTLLCKQILSEEKEEYKTFYMIFNYYTNSKNVQCLMQSCLEKKSGKQFSPPFQQKLIYFIDDINMPRCDDYNTQSAIELLCQYIDTNSWFDLEKLNLIKIANTKLMSCMNYNRGNFTVNPRLLRHFFILNISFPENNTVNSIFSVLLKGHFNTFKQDVADLVPSILKSTISLFYNIEKTFKRTATYFYYEFNLRDIHSIVKGLLSAQPNTFQDCDKLLFLWLHECERVYSDKLNKGDKKKFKTLIIDIVKKMYNKYEINKFVMNNDKSLIFSNFHKGGTTSGGYNDKVYDMCKNFEELTAYLTEELNEYNSFYNLNIVLFNDAIRHICKLIRIIDNLKSHALLLGIGGCGKTTISKFSSYISSKSFFEMDFSAHSTDNDVKKYLQNIFYKCGMKNEDIILFLKESKIHDSFFIYVNEYMCSKNIIDLYTKEEKDYIVQNMRNIAKAEGVQETDSSIFEYFLKKVNENLHFILCFSPTSNNFRDKSNNFQCILNNTMIDIYDNWESDSLLCVGQNYVSNIYMNMHTGDIELSEECLEGAPQNGEGVSITATPQEEHVNLKGIVTEYLKECYEDLLQIASNYYAQERAHIYITPKLYLESIKTYHMMLLKNITSISKKMDMLKSGITKMNETSANVENIKNCLKEKKKISEEKKEASEKYAIDIGNEKMIVKKESDLADIEEQKCLEIQKTVLKQQEECENDIALGIPLIEQAEEALNTLNKKNIQELKTLNKPPPGVEDITAAVMQLLATIDTTISVDKFGKIKDRSWKSAQKMMINPEKFISLLKDYKNKIDENLVPDCNFKYVENLINLPHFNKNAIQKKSKAAAGLAEWVLNVTSFHKIIQNILPKRTLLENTKKSLEEANEKLQTVREKVQSLKAQLSTLISQYDHALYERDLVILEEKKLKTKLELSIRLIDALSSEQISWSNQYEALKKKKKTILTDILLSSTFVTFCGGFTKKYRNKIMTKCVETLNRKNQIQNEVFSEVLKKMQKGTEKEKSAKANAEKECKGASIAGSVVGRNNNGVEQTGADDALHRGDASPSAEDSKEDLPYDIFSVNTFNLDLLINEETLSKLSKQGLTLNSVCIENNLILENSEKFPIIIDPQMESLKWLINSQKEKSEKLIITDINDSMLFKKIIECLSFGYSIIIENADENIDNSLYNIISKNIIRRKDNYYININDKEYVFHPSFYIILHTQLSNPHYQPEIQSACSLINFTVTPDDLEEHLLSITLENEFNHLSKKRKKLSLLKYDYMCQLSFLQSSILQKLTNAKGDILEDVSLIENLETTKLLSENITKKTEIVKSTEVHINTIINLYRPLSRRGVMYFFILQKLKNIHSFYFYSLEIFLKIFIKCLNDCAHFRPPNSGPQPRAKSRRKRVIGAKLEVTQKEEESTEPNPIASPVEPNSIASPVEPNPIASPVEPNPIASPVEPNPIASPVEPNPIASPVEPEVIASPVETEVIANTNEHDSSVSPTEQEGVNNQVETKEEGTAENPEAAEVAVEPEGGMNPTEPEVVANLDELKEKETTEKVEEPEVAVEMAEQEAIANLDEPKEEETEEKQEEPEVPAELAESIEPKVVANPGEPEPAATQPALENDASPIEPEPVTAIDAEEQGANVNPVESESAVDPAESESVVNPVEAEVVVKPEQTATAEVETPPSAQKGDEDPKKEDMDITILEKNELSVNESGDSESDSTEFESDDLDGEDAQSEETKIDKNEVQKRVNVLISLLIEKMWMYIDKGLLERDKLIVKCLIMLNLEKLNGNISQEEEDMFINPKCKLKASQKENEGREKKMINKSFMSEDLYQDCKNLENLKEFDNLTESLESESMSWKQWFLSDKVENEELPRKYNNLKDFSKLLLIRVLRKDRFPVALKNYIQTNIKMTNDEKNTYALDKILEEYIDNKTPVLFLLTPGNDPSKDIEEYVAKLKRTKGRGANSGKKGDNTNGELYREETISYVNISMGQGQESIALKYLKETSKSGGFIFLQNIHLMTKWLKEFEEILDKILTDAHPNFRLFLSSAIPSEKDTNLLPEKLLKKCFRINNEKSFSLKDNIKCSLEKFQSRDYDDKLKNVIFGLSYYHSLLLGRFLYGKIGFSQSYSFNDNDLEISFNIIKRYLESYNTFPLADVLFLIGEIIYGGHITDIWDRRINKTYVKNVLKEIYKNVVAINGRAVSGEVQDIEKGDDENDADDEGHEENSPVGENDTNGRDATHGKKPENRRGNDDEDEMDEQAVLKDTRTNILFELFKFPDCTKYSIAQLKKYVDEKLNKEQTCLLGLHVNAEIEYMKNECSRILQNLQEISSRDISSSQGSYEKGSKTDVTGNAVGSNPDESTLGNKEGSHSTDGRKDDGKRPKESDEAGKKDRHKGETETESGKNETTKIIYDIINRLLNELPEKIDISDLKIEDTETNTFMVIALKESEKFNALIDCIYDSLVEIKLVLDGILNMNNKIQLSIKALLLHNIPEIWKSFSYPSKKKLLPWFEDFKLRVTFLQEWIAKIRCNIFLPNSVWLSALFNPISFLTAIKQKFSHENRVPIDKLKLKWHVTNITKVEDLNNKNNSLYIHGLFLQGASWFINSQNDSFTFDMDNLADNVSYGNLVESVPKNIFFPMPLVYVYCVTNEQDEQLARASDARYLDTPLYITSDRGGTFVCSVDLNLETDDIEDKWILAGVALFLSDE